MTRIIPCQIMPSGWWMALVNGGDKAIFARSLEDIGILIASINAKRAKERFEEQSRP